MFCSNCGTAISGGEKFCPECGAPIEIPVQPEPTAVSEQEPLYGSVATPRPEYRYEPNTTTQPVYGYGPNTTPQPAFTEPAPAPKKTHKALWIILCCVVLAAICGAVLLMLRPWNKCGPKSPETIVRESMEKLSDVESQHIDVVMNMGISVSASGMNMNLDVDYDIKCDATKDPSVTRMEITVCALGMQETNLAYTEMVGDELRIYISSDDGKTWEQPDSLPTGNLNNLSDASSMQKWDIRNLTEIGTETVNGAPATVYSGVMPADSLNLGDEGNETEVPIFGELDFSDLKDMIEDIPIKVWVDQKSGRLVRFRMDLTQLMSALMQKLLGEEMMAYSGADLDYTVNNMTIECTFSQFNEIPPIVIPEEARNN